MSDDQLLKDHQAFFGRFIKTTIYGSIAAVMMFAIVFVLTT